MPNAPNRCLALAVVGACVSAFGSVPSASAQEETTCARYTFDRGAVDISGRLGDDESFVGSFEVSTGEQNSKPVFIATGLTGPNGTEIPQGRIAITQPGELVPNQPSVVSITVKGIRFAGAYTGGVRLAGKRCQLDLRVVAAGQPALAPLGGADSKATLRLVRCAHLTCGPGDVLDWLVSDLTRRDRVTIQVENSSQTEAVLTEVQVALRRDPGEDAVPAEAVSISLPTSAEERVLGPRAVASLPPVELDRDALEPGHYSGAIYLTLADAEQRVKIPIELDVKDGPFWAIVALFAALLAQLAVSWATRNKPRKAELKEYGLLKAETSRLHPDDQLLLQDRLSKARDLIVKGNLKDAKGARTAIREDAERLEQARALEQEARKHTGGGELPASVTTPLVALRKAIKEDKAADARGNLTDLRDAVRRLSPRRSFRRLLSRGVTTQEISEGPAPRGRIDFSATARRVWSAIATALRSASRSAMRWLRYWLLFFSVSPLPWLLRALFVAAFLLAGLHELYYKDSTFGEEPVLDYSVLFIWGLSATVINKALGSIIPDAKSEAPES